MPRYEHLRLYRLPEMLARRKAPGFGAPPSRDPDSHSKKLDRELNVAVSAQQRRSNAAIDPSLIFRVRMEGALLEDEWEALGLSVLASDLDRTLVLFASPEDIQRFRERLGAYAEGIKEGRKSAAYASFIDRVLELESLASADRIGVRLREEGFRSADDFLPEVDYVLDVEIWEIGNREARERELDRIANRITELGGDVFDQYVGPAITLLRAKLSGSGVRSLLEISSVASVDRPPEPDLLTGELLEATVDDMPSPLELDDDCPVLGIIDSGLNRHPLLQGVVVGSIGVPSSLGDADEYGHGTSVSGIAAFGDLRQQIASGSLQPAARIASARVVNANGAFDDRQLVPSQMREAISRLHAEFGCRAFVIALGDSLRVYRGGKVGSWAATLDELARELDVVILVSAGNRNPRSGERLEEAVTAYPSYLLEDDNRLFEPAGAINVITVGALAHGTGIGPGMERDAHIRHITSAMEPAPFTRVGPGVSKSCKPDVVDVGGTMVFDAMTARLRRGRDLPSAGVLSLNHRYTQGLFVAGSGTSFAVPLVANKLAGLLRVFPNASANLLRALLVGAAVTPQQAEERLQSLGTAAIRRVCGYGVVDSQRAAFSDEHRVVFFTEDELPQDHFAVYEIPIPEVFQDSGRRTISVTLAYDPPVRHTRVDYAGTTMDFRLVRGCDPGLIFEHYRSRKVTVEGRHPELPSRFNCDMKPGPTERECGTVQSARISFTRGMQQYGDSYFLIVRTFGGWAASIAPTQKFAIVVELAHESSIQLYSRVRARLRV